MLKTDVVLDHNWVGVTILAGELKVHHSTVSNWIKGGKIDYVILRGLKTRRHLVDRRTAPATKPRGRPPKPRLKRQPLHS